MIRKPGEDKHNHVHTHTHNHGDQKHSHPHSHYHHHDNPHDQHDHNDHAHEHHKADHNHTHRKEILLEQDILHKNNLLAERNRGFFDAKNIFAINLVSSPGSGKTTLLEKTIKKLGKEIPLFIIEGDQQTMNDANRINKAGAPVVQVNTGSGCHLDANMIYLAIKKLEPADNSVLFIENVGNLICPSMFDLGESKRVVIISVTEGEDKPIKYPTMFETSDLCIINKTDLLQYVDFNIARTREHALMINHHLEFLEISAKTGEGMDTWYDWVKSNNP